MKESFWNTICIRHFWSNFGVNVFLAHSRMICFGLIVKQSNPETPLSPNRHLSGHKPTPKHEIDRFPDNKGNYEPLNCRWASHKENNRNKTNNHLITAFGETKTIQDWAEDARCVVSANTLLYRVRDTAYPPELLITISAYTNSREFKRALAEFGSQCLTGRK